MRAMVLALAGMLAAGPALAQERDTYGYPSDQRPESSPLDEALEMPGSNAQQQAELPQEAQPKKKHPGTLTKLRGAFMDSPGVEGDEYPESSLGIPAPKGWE